MTREELWNLYVETGSVRKLAVKLGCGRECARRRLAKAGFFRRRVGRPGGVSPENHQTAILKYQNGASLREVGLEYGVTHEAIRRLLHSYELKARDGSAIRMLDVQHEIEPNVIPTYQVPPPKL